jgi:4-hydroxy-3-methylbut-2-enyl diphosphate reductase
MITAHGSSKSRVDALGARGHKVLEATCPLVQAAHQALEALVRGGYYPVVVGKRDHVEVKGLTGDLSSYSVVLTEDDLERLPSCSKYGVVAQTTQPVVRVRHLAQCIRARFPGAEVRLVDTVCQPTKLRQQAAETLARECDMVVVIGGRNSNNTRELVATCAAACPSVVHVTCAAELSEDLFMEKEVVGVTAGTSTPDWLIQEVAARLEEIAANQAASRSVLTSASGRAS